MARWQPTLTKPNQTFAFPVDKYGGLYRIFIVPRKKGAEHRRSISIKSLALSDTFWRLLNKSTLGRLIDHFISR